MQKISIITPSYNQGDFIEQTIDSVLRQNYPDLEYIIIDGGSQDNTLDIIRKYEKYITYWISEPDQGQSDAINKGLKLATGDIINWLNSDDYYALDALKKVAEAFQNEKVNVVCGRSRLFQDNRDTVKYSRGTDIYPHNLAKTLGLARIDQPETFFRRSAVDQMGFLNPSLNYVMDKEWWIRYLLAFGLSGIEKLDEVLVNFRLHDSSKTVCQRQGFEFETNALYLKLAEWFGFETERNVIEVLMDYKSLDYTFHSLFVDVDKKTVLAALHYYLLQKADLFYYRHERELSQFCLRVINELLLDQEDCRLVNKLRFRNKFFPVAFTKLVRSS